MTTSRHYTVRNRVFGWITPDEEFVPMKVHELLFQLNGYFDDPDLEMTIRSHLEALVESLKDA